VYILRKILLFESDFYRYYKLFVFLVGAVLAGLPFSYVAKLIEWKGAFILLEILLVGVLVMKIVMRKVEYKMVPTKKKLQ